MKKPIIGITMGDPASIGPEISVKALTDPKVLDLCDPLIIGDAAVMDKRRSIKARKFSFV